MTSKRFLGDKVAECNSDCCRIPDNPHRLDFGVNMSTPSSKEGAPVGGQTRVDLATLAFFPCFIGFFGPVNGVNLVKTL